MDPKITVVDSIMGSGKTRAMISLMGQNPDKNYIFITPYLSETKRIIETCAHPFHEPKNYGKGKLASLHHLLSSGKSVVSTHALFLRANDETIQLIKEGGYTLVLDEALNVLQDFNSVQTESPEKCIKRSDIDFLINENIISIDNYHRVSWIGISCDDGHYSEVERLANNGTLHCIDRTMYWEFPIDVFKSFEEIFILTYLFEGTILSGYLQIHNLSYDKLSATKLSDELYILTEYVDDSHSYKAAASLISIYEGHLNDLGERHNAFSITWLTDLKKDRIKAIQNAMISYKRLTRSSSKQILWTTAKSTRAYKTLNATMGFKYIKRLSKDENKLPDKKKEELRCFLSCNARATNAYKERNVLLYLVNRYFSPEIEKYFAPYNNVHLDESVYATSELIQWIWRSAIRDGEPIQLYVPSSRMRSLLYEWLGVK